MNLKKLRHDPRLVAPLTIVAIFTTGYALMQSMPKGPPPKVAVKEIGPQAMGITKAAHNHLHLSVVRSDPYFHPRLLTAEEKGVVEENPNPDFGVEGLYGNLHPVRIGQTSETSAQPNTGAGGAKSASQPGPEPKTAPVKSTKPQQKKDSGPVTPEPPDYRLSAVLWGTKPLAVLVGPDNTPLYVTTGDKLPTGEIVKILSRKSIRLTKSGHPFLIVLSGEEEKKNP